MDDNSKDYKFPIHSVASQRPQTSMRVQLKSGVGDVSPPPQLLLSFVRSLVHYSYTALSPLHFTLAT